MATIQEILDKINASKSNNINNNSFIDLMRQISGNPEDVIQPVNDTNSIYGHIVQMYTTLYAGGIDYAVLADEVDMLQGVYDSLIAINSVYADKTKLDSIYADKLTLDSLYADKDKLDQLFADKAVIDRLYRSVDNIARVHTSIDKLDAVYADILNIDTVSNNLANIDIAAESDNNITIVADSITDVNVVANNMTVLNEIYNNRVEIYAADDNATIATTKAAEASASSTASASSASAAAASAGTSTTKANEAATSASTALGYKNDVSTMKLAIETIYDTFDDRFLGTKTTNPLVDNDGNALIDGALYFDTTTNAMKVYDVGTSTWYAMPQIYLNSLLDVQLTSLTTGNILVWNGIKWVNVLLTKASIGLANVDNTSDITKPVSTAQQTALNLKANLASPTFTGTVSGVTKVMVGLGSVDNTSDATKNVLSATKLATARTINGVSFDGSANITVSDSTAVKLTGNQTVAGVKTFTSSPIVPVPTTDFQSVPLKSTDITVNVGSGQTYTTINQALEYLSGFYPMYKKSGVVATINLKAGFVMAEQVLVSGIDLGWITIVGEDSETIITHTALTTSFSGANYPAFGVDKGGTSPAIGQLFRFNVEKVGGNKHGLIVIGAGSRADILPNKGFIGAGVNGINALAGAIVNADAANCSNAGNFGINAYRSSIINANGANCSNAGASGINASAGSTINAFQAIIQNQTTGYVRIQVAAGSHIEASLIDTTGGTVPIFGQAVNTLTSNGIIYS